MNEWIKENKNELKIELYDKMNKYNMNNWIITNKQNNMNNFRNYLILIERFHSFFISESKAEIICQEK